jgi:universal stress protein A
MNMTISIKRILVATDFSAAANHALSHACELAGKFGAELHVLHVVVEPFPVAGTDVALIRPGESVANMIQKAKLDLAANTKELPLPNGTRQVTEVIVGDPIERILKYAEENQIDLMTLGTHGHRGLSHLLLGSVAEKIVRLAKCPVLTVHAPGTR